MPQNVKEAAHVDATNVQTTVYYIYLWETTIYTTKYIYISMASFAVERLIVQIKSIWAFLSSSAAPSNYSQWKGFLAGMHVCSNVQNEENVEETSLSYSV